MTGPPAGTAHRSLARPRSSTACADGRHERSTVCSLPLALFRRGRSSRCRCRDTRLRDAAEVLTTTGSWYPAIDSDGDLRDGAWVAEATHLVDMSSWPAGTRLILRKERPHPGAQLRFTDSDGLRVTAFITDTAPGVVPGQLAGLELRHRQHARVEDRIRQAKATGLRNLPCHRSDVNAAWLEILLAATDRHLRDLEEGQHR